MGCDTWKKSEHFPDDGMAGIREIKLSWGSKAHDEGSKRLLCDSGVSAGERPQYGEGFDAAH
jgi:hypothetical protein